MRKTLRECLRIRPGFIFRSGRFGNLVESVCNCGVVRGRGGERLLSQPPASLAAQGSVGDFQFFDESGIIGNAGHDGHVFKVLGGGAHHGGPADVDVFDEVAERNSGLCGSLFKRVEIHDDHVDGLNVVRGDCGLVLGIAANVKQATVDPRVQCLYAAVKHLRKAGEIADVFHGQAGLAESASCTACRDQFNAEARQDHRKLNQPCFVCYAEQRPPNLLARARRCTHSFTPCDCSSARCRIFGAFQVPRTKEQTTSRDST